MREEFRKELEPLLGVHMDAAFVVMDMRLEERYKNGIDYFLHTMDADAVFPMHLWGRYDLIPQYKKKLILAGEPELAKKVMDIREENQIFEL